MALTIVEARAITGGVDTDADTHGAAPLDPVGGLLGVREFPTTPVGYAGLLGWLGGFGTVCLVGIEGTGSYEARPDPSRHRGRDGGACTATCASRDRRLLRYSNWSLLPRCRNPSRSVSLTRHQQGFTGVHWRSPLPVIPLTCGPRARQSRLAVHDRS